MNAMAELPLEESYDQSGVGRMAAALILVFWAMFLGSLTWQRMILYPDQGLGYMVPRTLATAVGVMISFGIVRLQGATAHWTLAERVAVAVSAALLGCTAHALGNVLIFSQLFGLTEPFEFADFMFAVVDWMWFYLTLSLVVLALRYSAEIRSRERRLAAMAASARAAQIRALRYQLNPHFLFNTLNSIAALVRGEQDRTAETMIENLCDFLHTGLALDPHEDIPLEREIELQGLYLDIERLRFPERMQVTIDVPPSLRGALVPALITQPLIENAIKYGVARSAVPVGIGIGAREAAGMIEIRVADDGGDAPLPAESGTKLGLGNVEGRLRARFGDNCRFAAGPRAGGGFEAVLAMPLRLAEPPLPAETAR